MPDAADVDGIRFIREADSLTSQRKPSIAMAIKSPEALETLESLAAGVVALLSQVAHTFIDMLLRPRLFARRFCASPVDSRRYVAPYTFLGVTGFLGTKALLATTISTVRIVNEYLRGEDTLQAQSSVLEQMVSWPTVNDLLITSIPLIVSIYVIGITLSFVLSRERNVKVSQSLYYAAGIQYLIIGSLAMVSYKLWWSDWELPARLDFALFLLALIGTFGLPAVLITMIARRAIGASARRAGRAFPLILPPAALLAAMITAILPYAATRVLMGRNPADLRPLAVLRVVFAGSPVVAGDSIALPVIVTNQQQSQLFISTKSASLTTTGVELSKPDVVITAAIEWQGRVFDPDRQADVLSVPAGASLALRFEGKRHREVGLTDEAQGRLELMQVKTDGTLDKIVAHVWKPKRESDSVD